MEKVKVFLGGTCASSTWRGELGEKLDNKKIDAFNPVVPNWTPECQKVEDYHRDTDDICLYTITPEGQGFYSFVEVVDDSNKRPDSTVLCVLLSANGKRFGHDMSKTLATTMELVKRNGATVTEDLDSLAAYLNGYKKAETKKDKKEQKNNITKMFVITPESDFSEFILAIDASNKDPKNTYVCILMEYNGKKFEGHIKKCVEKTAKLLQKNGAYITFDLNELNKMVEVDKTNGIKKQ